MSYGPGENFSGGPVSPPEPDDTAYEQYRERSLSPTNLDDVWVCAECPGQAHRALVREDELREHYEAWHSGGEE